MKIVSNTAPLLKRLLLLTLWVAALSHSAHLFAQSTIVNVGNASDGITYNGGWFNTRTGNINNDERMMNGSSNYCQYTFTGTGVDVIGYKTSNSSHGANYTISIDGASVATGNTTSTTSQSQTVFGSVTGLSHRPHTVKIAFTSGIGSTPYVIVDAFRIYTSTTPVTGVSVTPASVTIAAGETAQLSATILPANAGNQSVTWSSSATGRATVNASGLVTGIAAGSATITVTTADGSFTATSGIIVTPPMNNWQVIVGDMTLPPVAALHGVPSYYSWASGAAQPQPIPVPARNYKGEWFRALTLWGQVYIPVEGSPATNTRCQIRNLVTRVLHSNGTWTTVQSSAKSQGAAYVEDFRDDASIGAGERDETANGGGISVKVGVGPWAGHNYHFWPYGSRANVDINTIVGVFTTCEARLIVDDAALPDDRAICKNILQSGADWWLSQGGGWLPDWSANAGIAGGRAKWVTTNWQSFNMCSLLPADIMSNPPVGAPFDPNAVASVSVNPSAVWVAAAATTSLLPVILPANATDKTVTWSTSNPAVASVSPAGVVTGVAVGSAVLTVLTQDGNFTATSAVTVLPAGTIVTHRNIGNATDGMTYSGTAAFNVRTGSVNNDETLLTGNAASCQFAFTGTGLDVVGFKPVGPGSAFTISIDGIPASTGTTASATAQLQQEFAAIRNLTNGPHTVNIEAVGPPTTTTNKALNKPIYVSQYYTSTARAVDGNLTNEVVNQNTCGLNNSGKLGIDLGGTSNIKSIVMTFGDTFPGYTISGSNDQTNYTVLTTSSASTSGTVTLNYSEAYYRYVLVSSNSFPAGGFYYSPHIREIAVNCLNAPLLHLDALRLYATPTPFAAWQTANFTAAELQNPAISGPEASALNDGVSNLIKFASNIPAKQPAPTLTPGTGTSGLPAGTRQDFGGGPQLVFEFLRRRATTNPGITYTSRFSPDLSAWNAAIVTIDVTTIDATWERVRVRESTTTATSVRRFAQLLITQP